MKKLQHWYYPPQLYIASFNEFEQYTNLCDVIPMVKYQRDTGRIDATELVDFLKKTIARIGESIQSFFQPDAEFKDYFM
jgi:hypothetical protein